MPGSMVDVTSMSTVTRTYRAILTARGPPFCRDSLRYYREGWILVGYLQRVGRR